MRQTDLSGRFAHWSMKLQAYDVAIRHEKASQNVVPDALSKIDCDTAEQIGSQDSIPTVNTLDFNLEAADFEKNEEYQSLKTIILNDSEKYSMLIFFDDKVYIRVKYKERERLTDIPVWKLWVANDFTTD